MNWLLLGILLLFQSCYSIRGSDIPKTSSPVEICQSIQGESDIMKELRVIRENHEAIMVLLDEENPWRHEEEIHQLAQEIQESASRVRTVTRDEWTQEKWDYELFWRIKGKQLTGNVPAPVILQSAQIEKVFYMGQEREDLMASMILEENGRDFSLSFLRKASALEWCDLRHSLFIVIRIRFSQLGITRSRQVGLSYLKRRTE